MIEEPQSIIGWLFTYREYVVMCGLEHVCCWKKNQSVIYSEITQKNKLEQSYISLLGTNQTGKHNLCKKQNQKSLEA